jgi:site-specific DNA recombinase
MTSALLYARVSHDPSGRGRSVDSQLSECRQWADREGWTIAGEIRDIDRSASRHAKREREGWTDVAARLETGDVDVLVTWEASRAQRNLAAYAELRSLCERTSTSWAYSGTVYNLADRTDRFRTGLDALVSEDEADRISERVSRGVLSAAMDGRPTGRRLYGYRRIYDEHTGELVGQEADPVEAPIVAEAARRYLSGESGRSIARDFTERGVPTQAEQGWELTRIKRMLTNPAYNAQRVHRGKVIGPAAWPKLIDDETFVRLQAIFNDPSRAVYRRVGSAHLLSGTARCGVCGGPMTYAKDRNDRRSYQCKNGFHTARDGNNLDAFVTGIILERLARPDARQAISDDAPLAEVLESREQADALRARIDDATDEYVAGNLTASSLAKVEAGLLAQIAELDAATKFVGLPSTVGELVEGDVGDLWDRLTPEQKREVARSLLVVKVMPVKRRGLKRLEVDSIEIEWRV